ncbi:unnamed protein product [Paramecium primaurelia]|uniref:Uncharacterized protein n=1 Tax=Paramecium primaurelia TaxID=5886 RepID=A0A8S1PS10_PARPR|nr:unnamed protein product [Paramecium primaurelia]
MKMIQKISQMRLKQTQNQPQHIKTEMNITILQLGNVYSHLMKYPEATQMQQRLIHNLQRHIIIEVTIHNKQLELMIVIRITNQQIKLTQKIRIINGMFNSI